MKDRVEELEKLIVKHKILYYQGRVEISDQEYDALELELKKLNPKSLVLKMVGSLPTGSGEKVIHSKKMLSLDKTYKIDELYKWADNLDIFSTFKIDGTSCSLIYEDGNLTVAKTRGDGTTGENITLKAAWIDSIPKKIDQVVGAIEVRGEIFSTEKNFFHLSDEMVKLGFDRPVSQRNIVAGLLLRKENVELCRFLSFKAFEIYNSEVDYKTEEEKNIVLKQFGFSVPYGQVHHDNTSIKMAIDDAQEFMATGEYQIDGIVFSYNDIKLHEELGETAHHPRYKLAFKFHGESKNTVINEIIWSISRNGILTPVAEVEPIVLSGAKIGRVTLHNYGLVNQYRLKIGDEIEIIRSGEVIPKFISVIKRSDNQFLIPIRCPVCSQKVEIADIRLRCINIDCWGRKRESILNFIQKIGIDDLSGKRVDEMVKKEIIKGIEDLYNLTREDFLKLDNIKEKMANKLFDSIQKSKSVDLTTFLSALGIKGGAYNKCNKIVSSGHNSIEKIKRLTPELIQQIDSFAEKSSVDFYKSLMSKIGLIDLLLERGFSFTERNIDSEISGKRVCITGSLNEKRSVVEGRIREVGGIITGTVSKQTDYLLTNDKESNSSKAKKARALNIMIIDEQKLIELLQ